MPDRYEELYRSFRWNVPERYNMARACCGNWAADRGRFALYWEDESGAQATYTFAQIQAATGLTFTEITETDDVHVRIQARARPVQREPCHRLRGLTLEDDDRLRLPVRDLLSTQQGAVQ